MEKIASFCVDHNVLAPGIYLSRVDGDVVTYDIRMRFPNRPPFLENTALHTVEHLFATFARNAPEKDHVIYFGPMGCRTGFYLLLAGDLEPQDIQQIVLAAFRFIRDFDGPIPGAAARDCGNYLDMNLPMAKLLAARYLTVLENLDQAHTRYPVSE